MDSQKSPSRNLQGPWTDNAANSEEGLPKKGDKKIMRKCQKIRKAYRNILKAEDTLIGK